MKIKQSQKVRVIVNNISFHTTVKGIREGVGDFMSFNLACQQALEFIEKNKYEGYVGKMGDFILQLDLL